MPPRSPEARERAKEGRRSWYRKNKRRVLDSNMRARYGLTMDEYESRLVEQSGVCALCRQPETATRGEVTKLLAVDHDHASGAVRGLLCQSCNTGLGLFKDDPSLLRDAARYLGAADS